ncbi:hypothetical protein [Confluentibacter flavum]|uniref:Tetratricopeptide repeat protein n=1 Tax=Confluentibacter flavum TaxID=1909700 RepID=A0A2N3HHX4_9FLAO|nr:hypothetical protein [Confluentibacter flavum]PKQ44503.1 hypothetical protein CSW08_12680 [Confluentibacter flavum]
MNKQEFTYLLSNPVNITGYQTNAIHAIIESYPYFQSARALYLKGLKSQESFKYNQELKTTAAYTADRSILFDFITSEAFIQNEISQIIKQNDEYLKTIDVSMEDISVNKRVTIDDRLKQQIMDTTGALDPALFEPKEERVKKVIPFTLDTSDTIEEATPDTTVTQDMSASDILKLGKPLEFDKRESHSFTEWLKLTRFSPIKRDNDTVETPQPENKEPEISNETVVEDNFEKTKKFQLIDKFISQNPKIDPRTPANLKLNLAKLQNIQPEELMTETLARIYVEQKNYSKAIQSYKILSLKYPEKSSFFAIQIKAVEELQEQNNK